MRRFGKWFLVALGSLVVLLAIVITLTIGWSPFGPQGACSHEPHIRAYAATARERSLYRDGLEQLHLLSQPA